MGNWITLETPHGQVDAWQASPSHPPRAGLIIIQEIFGANEHIRRVADDYATHGYAVLAPAFFDPIEKNVELAYDDDGVKRGRDLVDRLGLDKALDIVASATARLRSSHETLAIGSVGYCWGGTVALLAALRLGLPSVSYYGARNTSYLDENAKAPVIFHFGERDALIPPPAVELHRQKLPQMQTYTYPADHAFNRDVGSSYEPASAALALQRSLAFLEANLK